MCCWCWHYYIPNNSTQCTVGDDIVIFLTIVNSVLMVLTLLHSKYLQALYFWYRQYYIPNSCTHCTSGADTVTFRTNVHSVLLVLTILHS